MRTKPAMTGMSGVKKFGLNQREADASKADEKEKHGCL